jgi:cytochrome b pre-mRNA-processing protein 3
MPLKKILGRLGRERPARLLYRRIVEQARQPSFYALLGVPDTVNGRFDMITLHAFLLFERLGREKDEKNAALAQEVFDEMFLDMDHNLREMGVSDVSVGKKVRRMAEIFYGRLSAYREALKSAGDDALRDALRRNIYGGVEAPEGALAELAAYVRTADAMLRRMADRQLRKGEVSFPPAPAKEQANER